MTYEPSEALDKIVLGAVDRVLNEGVPIYKSYRGTAVLFDLDANDRMYLERLGLCYTTEDTNGEMYLIMLGLSITIRDACAEIKRRREA